MDGWEERKDARKQGWWWWGGGCWTCKSQLTSAWVGSFPGPGPLLLPQLLTRPVVPRGTVCLSVCCVRKGGREGVRSVPTKLAQCSAHAKLPSERYQPVSPETAPRPGTDVCMYSPLCTNGVQKRRGLAAASRQFHSACHSARFACVRQPSGVLHCGLVLQVYLN